jgi:hypothetical protein
MSENETHSEDRVSERAYQLWEQAGCPEDRSDEFWFQAVSELQSGQTKAEAADPEPESEILALKAA